MRDQLGVLLNDGIQYEIIGKRVHGSFRTALRRYGLDAKQIEPVLAALDDCRDVKIQSGGHWHHFRAL